MDGDALEGVPPSLSAWDLPTLSAVVTPCELSGIVMMPAGQ